MSRRYGPRDFGYHLLGEIALGIALQPTVDFESSGSKVPPERLQEELRFLQIFTTDYVMFAKLGDTPTKNAVLDAFYDRLRKDPTWPAIDAGLRERLPAYMEAIKTDKQPGPHYWVGKVFAKYLTENGTDIMRVTQGTMMFTSFSKGIVELLDNLDPAAGRAQATGGGCASSLLVGIIVGVTLASVMLLSR